MRNFTPSITTRLYISFFICSSAKKISIHDSKIKKIIFFTPPFFGLLKKRNDKRYFKRYGGSLATVQNGDSEADTTVLEKRNFLRDNSLVMQRHPVEKWVKVWFTVSPFSVPPRRFFPFYRDKEYTSRVALPAPLFTRHTC